VLEQFLLPGIFSLHHSAITIMKRTSIFIFAISLCAAPLTAQELLPLAPASQTETIQPEQLPSTLPQPETSNSVPTDHAVSSFHTLSESNTESYEARRIRIAQERGDQRRLRLAAKKNKGEDSMRPVINAYAPLESYVPYWSSHSYVPQYNLYQPNSRWMRRYYGIDY
jgi:hypothetical protein